MEATVMPAYKVHHSIPPALVIATYRRLQDIPIKMRVFAANSEEARSVMECCERHAALPLAQQPFVLLAPSLHLAAMCDLFTAFSFANYNTDLHVRP
jgi:hypothetical protein